MCNQHGHFLNESFNLLTSLETIAAWPSDLVGRSLDWGSDLCTSLVGIEGFVTRQSHWARL